MEGGWVKAVTLKQHQKNLDHFQEEGFCVKEMSFWFNQSEERRVGFEYQQVSILGKGRKGPDAYLTSGTVFNS